MKKVETYKVFSLGSHAMSVDEAINSLSKEGWIFVSFIPAIQSVIYGLFKRVE